MSIRVQFKRGSKKALSKYIGRDGEIVIDSESKHIRVCDGVTAGGSFEIASADDVKEIIKTTNSEPSALENGTGVFYPSQNKIAQSLNVNIASLQNDIWGYNQTKSYAVGAYVIYQNNIYKCIQVNNSENVHAPTDNNYWDKLITSSELALARVPTGTSLEWTSDILPNSYLFQNGAEYENAEYPNLHHYLGYRYGSSTAVKAQSSIGTAFIAGLDGNNLRVTVTSSSSSYVVATYYNDVLVDSQIVESASDLKNHGYVVFDTSASLTDDANIIFSGGLDGTSFKVPDRRNRYGIGAGDNPLGLYIAEQLPNITGELSAPIMVTAYGSGTGALTYENISSNSVISGSDVNQTRVFFNASNSNAVYTDNGHVYPLSLALNYIIKT